MEIWIERKLERALAIGRKKREGTLVLSWIISKKNPCTSKMYRYQDTCQAILLEIDCMQIMLVIEGGGESSV